MTIRPEEAAPPQEEELEQAYHPNMREAAPTGGACFLMQSRVCGPDCMAYLSSPPPGKAYVGENWARCHLLVNIDRTGRHLALIHQEINMHNVNEKKRQADANRVPPTPKGG